MARKRSHDWRTIQASSHQAEKSAPNLKARAVLLEVVDNQLRDLDPPETKQTFDRLLAEGHSPHEAKRLIAYVLASEINAMMAEKQPYDEARYIAGLQRLPDLPF
jgi:hypothetical protein